MIIRTFCRLGILAGLLLPPVFATDKPNIVLITLDTVRADRMGFMGSKKGLTPNLDVVAREGIVFERAYAQAPLTPVAHASILTGLYPASHGVQGFGQLLPRNVAYLPEILRSQGYRTGAIVGSIVLDPQNGFAPGLERGFDSYDAGFRRKQKGESRFGVVERRAADVAGRAIQWVNAGAGKNFFLWLHIWDAHDPYEPPAPYSTRHASRYDGEIAYLDAMLGRLFAALRRKGLYENTIVAVVSDHGESLGEHGENTHGIFLYDAAIHVPFFLKLPQKRMAGRRSKISAGQVDVTPTVLHAAGIAVPGAMQGQSLLRLMASANPPERPSFASTDYPRNAYGWSPLASLRATPYLYVKAPQAELYDLAADPAARKNLVSSNGGLAARLARQLDDFEKRLAGSGAPPPATEIDPQTAERLRSLGYVASSGAASKGSGVDPKLRIQVHNQMHDANIAIEDGRAAEVIPLLQKVVATDPQIHSAQYYLGLAYSGMRQFAKAIPHLRKAIELQPQGTLAHYEMGLALFETGEWRTASTHFEIVVDKNPRWADARFSLAAVQARTERVTEALANLVLVVESHPQHYRANLLLGRLLALKNQAAEAIPYLEKAAASPAASAEAHLFLADAYGRAGRSAEASSARAKAAKAKRSGQGLPPGQTPPTS